jgi:proline dehydrogenase
VTLALAQRAARRYVAGPALRDALAVASDLQSRGLGCTIGYWNGSGEQPPQVLEQAHAAANALREARLDAYLSIKAPALGDSVSGLGELARLGVQLHLDALGADTVDQHLQLARKLQMGMTLPGRWRRSVQDADAATGLRVRVVKGQFPDLRPGREVDPRTGMLAVVDALAGTASFVAVASHDGDLAAEALSRLRAAGTPCGWELLYGLPVPRHAAIPDDVPVRVYVPYGQGYLPYALRKLAANPRSAGWLLKDLLGAPAWPRLR